MEEATDIEKRSRYHHGDLRAKLIEATRQLVEEKGPDHFSVSEACRLAGVSTAAPYKHFKDRSEMLRDVALEGMRRQHAQMMEEVAPHPLGSIARIIALGRVYVRFALAEPGVFRLMFGLSEDHDKDAALVACGHEVFGSVQVEVARYFGRGEVTPPDQMRAFLLWSFVHGLSFLQIDGKVTSAKVSVDTETMLADIADRVMNH